MKKYIFGALIYFDDEMFNVADVKCLTHSDAIICNVKSTNYAAEFQAWKMRLSNL